MAAGASIPNRSFTITVVPAVPPCLCAYFPYPALPFSFPLPKNVCRPWEVFLAVSTIAEVLFGNLCPASKTPRLCFFPTDPGIVLLSLATFLVVV